MMRIIFLALIAFGAYSYIAHPVETKDLAYTACYTIENLYHAIFTPGGKVG